jgi:hypothetical protein
MRKLGAVLWASTLLLTFHLGSSAAQAPPSFTLSIKPTQTLVNPGTDVYVDVVLKNISNKEIGFLRSTPELDYTVAVQGPYEKAVPETEFGRKVKDKATVSVGGGPIYSLKKLDTMSERIDISKLYELKKPGKLHHSSNAGDSSRTGYGHGCLEFCYRCRAVMLTGGPS